MRITGECTCKNNAAKYAAYIDIDNETGWLTLTVNDISYDYPFSQLRFSQALGSLPDSVFLPDGHCFTAFRGVHMNNLIAVNRKTGTFIHSLEEHKAAVIVAVIGILLTMFFYFRVFVPAASFMITKIIPDDFSNYLGQYSLKILDKQYFTESRLSAEKQQEVTTLFRTVTRNNTDGDSLPLKLVFRHSDKGANAFTLSDGTIIVTDSLIKIIEHDDELAAVLLHETGHHYYRHVMHSLVEASVLSITVMWLAGDINGIEEALLSSGSALFALSYSRNMETEADEFAVRAMKQQKRDPEMMKSIFTKLSVQSGDKEDSFLSTHPDWKTRLKTIDDIN